MMQQCCDPHNPAGLAQGHKDEFSHERQGNFVTDLIAYNLAHERRSYERKKAFAAAAGAAVS